MEIELPSHYQSWYKLWKDLENNGLLNEHKVIYSFELKREPLDGPARLEYNVSDIKEMLLQELLESANKVQDFTFEDLRQIGYIIQKSQEVYIDSNPLLEKVKNNMRVVDKYSRL